MHQSSTIKSSTKEAQVSLNPVLQDALVSLDVQLEEELIRYRRQRALGKAGHRPGRSVYGKGFSPLNLMTTGSRPANQCSDFVQSEEILFSPTEKVPPLAAIAPNPAEVPANPSLELKELAKQYASQVAEESDLASTQAACPDDYLESSEELLRSLAQEEAAVQTEQSFMHSLLTPLGMGSMLLLLLSSVMFGFVVMNPSSVSQLFASRNGQAGTSSVAGVNNSISDQTAQPAGTDAPQPNLANQEFPDLSLGTLGSVQVGDQSPPAAIAGKGFVNPNKGQQSTNLGLKGSSPVLLNPERITASLGTSTAPKVSQSAPEPPPPSISVPSPRKLSAGPTEAPPVRSYSPPAPRRADPPPRQYSEPAPVRSYNPPAKAPIVKAPAAKTRKSTPIQPYQPAYSSPTPTYRSPAPVYRSPASTPSELPSPAAIATPTTSGAGYKVVTPYTSDRSLEQAREKVPEAYLNNYSDGAKVQLGSYKDEASAKARAEELRQQGVPAEVYKP